MKYDTKFHATASQVFALGLVIRIVRGFCVDTDAEGAAIEPRGVVQWEQFSIKERKERKGYDTTKIIKVKGKINLLCLTTGEVIDYFKVDAEYEVFSNDGTKWYPQGVSIKAQDHREREALPPDLKFHSKNMEAYFSEFSYRRALDRLRNAA